MLDMPIRTRRRMQDAVRQIQEGFTRRTSGRQQVNSLHRQRMTCSESMNTYAYTQDWMSGMEMSPSGRFQVIEEAKPKRKVFTREGIRWDAAWIILAVTVVLCTVILLSDAAGIGMGARTISRLESKIEDMTQRNEKLKQEVAVNASDVSVCTEALKLNLISGLGAQTLYLTVPQQPGAEAITTEVRNASTGWMTSSAGN